jgi:hypothetical protein
MRQCVGRTSNRRLRCPADAWNKGKMPDDLGESALLSFYMLDNPDEVGIIFALFF